MECTSTLFPRDGKLIFHRGERGISASIRYHHRTERFFAPHGFDLLFNPIGEAEWQCELLGDARAVNCYKVRPIRRIWVFDKARKGGVLTKLKWGKNQVCRELNSSWDDVEAAFGAETANKMAQEAAETFWGEIKWEWLAFPIPED